MSSLGLRESGAADATEARFASAAQLREVLDRLLRDIDDDAEAGPRLRATRVPHRFCFPDLDVVLNVCEAEDPGCCLQWEFSDGVDWEPELSLEMSSDVANRFLQGRENIAIAIARGRITCRGNARAALFFLPAVSGLADRYRAIVERDYPHLLVSH